MTHLESVQTDPECPLLALPHEERVFVDIEFSWGQTPRQEAVAQMEAGGNPDDLLMDLGYEYRLTSPVAVALVECAIRQATGQCPFARVNSGQSTEE